jgi:hypothetical protein
MIEQLSVIVFTNGHQLTAMLTCVGPDAVRQHVTNGITGNGLAVVPSPQIAPSTIIGVTRTTASFPQHILTGKIAMISNEVS